MKPSLGRAITVGGLFLVALRLSVRLIGLLSVVILFRVLTPDDFGVVALAMIVVGLAEVLSEFGFDQNLLRKPDATIDDYHLTWSLNVIRGVAVAVVLAASAPLAASLLEDQRLTVLLWALAIVPLIDGVSSVGVIDFAKQLQFQREFRLRVIQKVASFLVTVALAFAWRNYWALVAGTLAGRIVGLYLGYQMHPYRPRFRLAGSHEVLRFSIWILLDRMLLYAGGQADKVIAQRVQSPSTVGIMRVAEEISGIVMELVWPIEKALTAGYAQVVTQLDKLRNLVTTCITNVAMLGIPLSVGLGVLAAPSILLVLGEKGRPAIPFVQGLVIHGAIRSAICGVLPFFMAIGKPRYNTVSTILVVTVRLAALVVLIPWFGILAAPYCLALGSFASFLYVWRKLSLELGLSMWALPRMLGRTLGATAAMAVVGHALVLATADWRPVASVALCVPVCALVYVLTVLLLWRMAGSPPGPELTVIRIAQGRWARRLANSG